LGRRNGMKKNKIDREEKIIKEGGTGGEPPLYLKENSDLYSTTQWRAELEGKSFMSRTIGSRGSSVGDGKDIELVRYIFGMYRVFYQFFENKKKL